MVQSFQFFFILAGKAKLSMASCINIMLFLSRVKFFRAVSSIWNSRVSRVEETFSKISNPAVVTRVGFTLIGAVLSHQSELDVDTFFEERLEEIDCVVAVSMKK